MCIKSTVDHALIRSKNIVLRVPPNTPFPSGSVFGAHLTGPTSLQVGGGGATFGFFVGGGEVLRLCQNGDFNAVFGCKLGSLNAIA